MPDRASTVAEAASSDACAPPDTGLGGRSRHRRSIGPGGGGWMPGAASRDAPAAPRPPPLSGARRRHAQAHADPPHLLHLPLQPLGARRSQGGADPGLGRRTLRRRPARHGEDEARAAAIGIDPGTYLRRQMLGHLPVSAATVEAPGALLAFDFPEAALFGPDGGGVARDRLVLINRLAAALARTDAGKASLLVMTTGWPPAAPSLTRPSGRDGAAGMAATRFAALQAAFDDAGLAAPAQVRLRRASARHLAVRHSPGGWPCALKPWCPRRAAGPSSSPTWWR